jgi:hypothetical protein
MADKAPRRPRTPRLATVLRTSRPTPHLVRVVLGGEGLAGFAPEHTDAYVKLVLPPAGAPYAAPFDMDAVQREHPRELWPCLRTYTVRAWDPVAGELVLDVVVHGDEGLAGPWAVAARPGDRVQLLGPGGAYAPSTDVDWHLLAGDETALPAIAASLERPSAGPRSPPARCTPSCTARPGACASCAATCGWSGPCPVSSSRRRATGAWVAPMRAGGPRRRSGTPRWRPTSGRSARSPEPSADDQVT